MAENKALTKLRVLAVYMIIMRNQKVTTRRILAELERKYGITVDRKTIYTDISALDRLVPIKIEAGRNGGYSIHDVYGEAE